MNKKFILVGAKPSEDPNQHPGGQLTASIGLAKYAESKGFELEIIDTTQSSFPIPPFKERLKKGLARARYLWQKLDSKSVQGVVIFSSTGFSFYERIFLSFLCEIVGVKSIFFVRSGHFINDVKRSGLKRRVASLLLKIPSVIGAQGESWVKFYKQLNINEDKIITVRNWLPSGFELAEQPKTTRNISSVHFVFVGWIVEQKGVQELLNAAKKLAEHHEFKLTLLGGGDLEDKLISFVRDNNLSDKVELLGWQPREVVKEYLSKADVFVLPSKAEGFPNAMLEAMGGGLPVIATNVGAIGDTLADKKNGFLLEGCNAESIESSMKSYILSPELIATHSSETIKRVRDLHDYEMNCRQLFAAFNS